MILNVTENIILNRSIQYQCERCGKEFCLLDNEVVCPSCGSRDLNRMVIIYMEDDPEMFEMYTEVDWVAGD